MTAPNYDPLLVPAMTAADQPQPDERMHAMNSFICGTGGCLMPYTENPNGPSPTPATG
jgi:hypothetical protein